MRFLFFVCVFEPSVFSVRACVCMILLGCQLKQEAQFYMRKLMLCVLKAGSEHTKRSLYWVASPSPVLNDPLPHTRRGSSCKRFPSVWESSTEERSVQCPSLSSLPAVSYSVAKPPVPPGHDIDTKIKLSRMFKLTQKLRVYHVCFCLYSKSGLICMELLLFFILFFLVGFLFILFVFLVTYVHEEI